jgi:hypothetical protein
VTALLRITLETEPFERARADLAIAGFFPNERPLRGAAGRADWRLCGLASDLLADGRLREKSGEALLVPAGGRLAAPRVLLLALGRRSSLSAPRIRSATAAAIRRAIGLGARSLALAPLVGEEGLSVQAAAVLGGAVDAVLEAGATVDLGLVVSPHEVASARRSLEDALRESPVPEVELAVGPKAHTAGAGRSASQPGSPGRFPSPDPR